MIYIIVPLDEKGRSLFPNLYNGFISRDAADFAAQYHYKLERWSTQGVSIVDMNVVNGWIGEEE